METYENIERLRKYFDIWSGGFLLTELVARFQNLVNHYHLFEEFGGYDPSKSFYERLCATETEVLPNGIFTNVVLVFDKNELNFEPLFYTRSYKDWAENGYWYNKDRTKRFGDPSFFSYEIEHFTTDFVPITAIKEIWIYKNAWIKGIAESNIEKAYTLADKYGIPIYEKRLILTRAHVVGLAFAVFEDVWSYYLSFTVKDYWIEYPSLKSYSPLVLDLGYLVDEYHGYPREEPIKYSYSRIIQIRDMDRFNSELSRYIEDKIFTLYGTSRKPLLEQRVKRMFWKIFYIYFDLVD